MSTKTKLLTEFELFRGNGGGIEGWFSEDIPEPVVEALSGCDKNPISLEVLNQLLILSHEAGMTNDFFKFYFLSNPHQDGLYWYDPRKLTEFDPRFLQASSVESLAQLRWGLKRLYIDGLLYFGNIRQAYRSLRVKSRVELDRFFRARIWNTSELQSRSDYLPLEEIGKDDRYLIGEVACKTYAPADESMPDLMEFIKQRYDESAAGGSKRIKIKDLISETGFKRKDYDEYQLSFSLDEEIDREVSSSNELEKVIRPLIKKFNESRTRALRNTRLYLSMVSDLDVYVATSMRMREDYRSMADFCEYVFGDNRIGDLKLRYFDPTLSAAESHEDKGLLECLMVKCAKMLIYNAGKADSYGKDAEAAMALSLGKPVIFYCDTETKRKIFQEIHPLSRLINFHNGVAVGTIVMDELREVPEMVRRIFMNDMEFELTRKRDGYFLLKEQLTNSTIRVQSSDSLLRETFWNYYHHEPPYRRG